MRVFAGVVVNEIYPNPAGSNEDGEWIELYNDGSSEVNISGWSIDDIADGGANPYVIASGSAIAARGFLVFDKSQTNIGLNNSGDTVRLLNESGTLVDSYSFSTTSEDVSLGRSADGSGSWGSCTSLTRGGSNVCPLPTATPTPTLSPTSTPTPTATPTPTPNNTPTPTPTSTPTPASNAASPTPTPTAKNTPTPLLSPVRDTEGQAPTPQATEEQGKYQLTNTEGSDDSEKLVLGAESSPMALIEDNASGNDKMKALGIAGACTALGLAILMGVTVWNKRSQIQQKQEEQI